METRPSPPREVAVPAVALPALRDALIKATDPLVVTHAFHGAGFATGSEVFQAFSAAIGTEDPSALPSDRFWHALAAFLKRGGWGTLEYREIHPALGQLTSFDWAEAGGRMDPAGPGCAFSSGMLAALLGEAARGPVAVLEVGCRARGADACSFIFGAEDTVNRLYGFLLEGRSLQDSLDDL
jgi:hypothetical protein